MPLTRRELVFFCRDACNVSNYDSNDGCEWAVLEGPFPLAFSLFHFKTHGWISSESSSFFVSLITMSSHFSWHKKMPLIAYGATDRQEASLWLFLVKPSYFTAKLQYVEKMMSAFKFCLYASKYLLSMFAVHLRDLLPSTSWRPFFSVLGLRQIFHKWCSGQK